MMKLHIIVLMTQRSAVICFASKYRGYYLRRIVLVSETAKKDITQFQYSLHIIHIAHKLCEADGLFGVLVKAVSGLWAFWV
jgi:hypothetical protein